MPLHQKRPKLTKLLYSKQLLPLLDEYREVADLVVDGMSEWLVMIDSVVDRTIIMNKWTAKQLERIEGQNAKLPAQLERLVRQSLGKSTDRSKEAAVQKTFTSFSQQISDDLKEGLSAAVSLRTNLESLRKLLGTIKTAVKTDQFTLGQSKTDKDSTWRKIFSSHRDMIKDFGHRI